MKKSKENRIKAEITRLNAIFQEKDENIRGIVEPLISSAAFMRVQLEDLQEAINNEGVTDEYRNGERQYGHKASATLQAYVSLQKVYVSVLNSLSKYLPPEKKNTLNPLNWEPREKTEEELEEERRQEEEHRKRIDAEFARAVEYQRRQREGVK